HIYAEKDRDRMPPPESKKVLTEREKELLKEWIVSGAEHSPHWAFQPPTHATIPTSLTHKDWARGPVDAFILGRLEREGLAPSPEADRTTLIRRVTFDLTGLPPTIEDVDAFLADESPDAYEKVVNRLLSSPQYGEHLASQWLDVARFADTFGYQSDVVTNLWPWRDWVIEAFNANMPYNQFVTEQLAGDLLPNATQDQVLATAFNRLHRQTNEGGSVNEEFRVEYTSDRTQTFATAFMGVSLECARCHDHKFDPISQQSYYEMTAFFNNIDESGLYSHFTHATPTPTLNLHKNDSKENHEALLKAISEAELSLRNEGSSTAKAFKKWRKKSKRFVPEMAPEIHLTFDDAPEKNKIINAAKEDSPGEVSGDYALTDEGKQNSAVYFTGESLVTIKNAGVYDRYHPFSISAWIYIEETLPHMVIAHRTKAASDAGSRGYELMLDDRRLTFGLIHFWPGDALRVQSEDKLPEKEWVHITATYDGSSRASGIHLYVNGEEAAFETLRDKLQRTIWYNAKGDDPALQLGARFRDNGFRNGRLDDFMVFPYALTRLEVTSVATGNSLAKVISEEIGRAPDSESLHDFFLARVDDNQALKRESLFEARKGESKKIDGVRQIMVMRDMTEIRPTYMLHRGEYTKRGDQVSADTPPQLLPFPKALPKNRLGLAQWLLDPMHPLTARVAVNRLWQQCFGQGIVVTAEDFGVQGSPPSHPELLDHLALAFRNSGWDTKAFLRELVLSSTYRQDSAGSRELIERDPDNVLLAHGARYRRSAEEIRDAALASSGLLVSKIGGPSVKPYQPEGIWHDASSQTYKADTGDGLYRRTMYTFIKRTVPPPSMLTFDATPRDVCTVRRERTTTPLQALILLNDPQYVEAARILADRVLAESGGDVDESITTIFRKLLTRHPSEQEHDILKLAYDEQLKYFKTAPEKANAYRSVGEKPADESLDPAPASAMTAIAQAIINHDEFQVKQ
ncbi:MAG TPA: DUF1553 domain-containing protein, partial [Candidatus Hydrogenedentes bacterium]|nr:DUF1553 domain-containing protein [Candidatus Hydrogenedentota bacterium]